MENQIPEFLMDLLKKEYGNDITNIVFEGYNEKRNTTLRINTIKTNKINVQNKLNEAGIQYQNVPWIDNALILSENLEKELEELDIYKNGEIYLQSLSSMLPPVILEPKPKENILDMCAAPGGKTTQMACLAQNSAYITACERNPIRVEKLKYNIEKQNSKRGFCNGKRCARLR